MARPREHGDATRDALLRLAGQVLTNEGAAGLSVRRLADEVGVSTRAIYSLFGSKEGLVRAMFVEGFEGLAAALDEVVQTEDSAADLVALGHAYRASALARPHLYAVMFDCPVPEFEPSGEDDALAIGTLRRLIEGVQRARAAGRIVVGEDEATYALWGLVHGLVSLELAGVPPGVDADAVAQAAIAGLVAGLGQDPRQ